MIYLVLGMHKSGTTLVARALHESGIPMGRGLQMGASYQELKYESNWAQEINDAILGVGRSEFSLKVTSKCLNGATLDERVAEKMHSGAGQFDSQYADWGFKDPRSALTYQYWRDNLPAHRLIVVYRDPLSVWRRYYRFIDWLTIRRPFVVWNDYNLRIIEALSRTKEQDVLYLCFDQLLSGRDEWERLERFVGRKLVEVCDPVQSANRFSGTLLSRLQYRLLRALAGSQVRDTYDRLNRLRLDQLGRIRNDA